MARTICVDGWILTRRFLGSGINRYLTNLLLQFQEMIPEPDPMQLQILVPSLAEINGNRWNFRPGFEPVACGAMRRRILWGLGMMMLSAQRLNADAIFLPRPAPISFKRKRLAVTVHDVIPLLFPRELKFWLGLKARHSYTSSLRNADVVFTDSHYSKADIVSFCGVPEGRVIVTPMGIDSNMFRPGALEPSDAKVLERYGIRQPYVLHVGYMQARKNVLRLVQAYRLLMDRRKDFSFQLVLCGEVGWGSEELFQIVRDPIFQNRVMLTGVVPDYDLAILYRGATCFAMPSLYEGFGLPVLEAMASGVPVLCSNRSSIPEVAGDAALYFNPESVEEMSCAMERLLCDSALRAELARRGLERAKQFSWATCAKTTLDVLKSL